MLDVNNVIVSVDELLKMDHNILLVYLFGSYVEGYANENSDVDFAVLFRNNIGLWTEMELQSHLSDVISFEKVDVVNLNKVPLKLQFEAISKGVLIYEANSDATEDYIERVLHLYHDREIRYKMFFEEYDASMKEEYIHNDKY